MTTKKEGSEFDRIKRNDEFITKIRNKVKKGEMFQLDPSIIRELENYLIFSRRYETGNERRIPSGSGGEKDLLEVASLLEENQSYKDRVVKISINLYSRLNRLTRIRKTAEAYIYKTYSEYMDLLRSESIRRTIIEDILDVVFDKEDEFKTAVKICEMVLQNLSSTHFVLSGVKDILMLVFSNKEREV